MSFTLPELPFDAGSLSPFNSAETFQYHHGKHHANYVNKLNELTANTPLAELSLEDLILKALNENNKPIYNNAAQHFNHSFFWNCLTPNSSKAPQAKLAEKINTAFGDFNSFKEKFSQTALTLFGSGWAWLALNSDGNLEILAMKDADTPLIQNKKPLLTIDVWEHAYYIDHRNARANFINEFWNVTNWDFAEKQLN